jgi:hypothetical protein
MNIKNYTSTVSIDKSINQIEHLISNYWSKKMKNYFISEVIKQLELKGCSMKDIIFQGTIIDKYLSVPRNSLGIKSLGKLDFLKQKGIQIKFEH